MISTMNYRLYLRFLQLSQSLHKHAYWVLVALLAGALISVLIPEAAMAKCKPDGVPERAGSGFAGLLDSRSGTMDGDSLYGDYGYAGLRWNACDLGGPIAGNEWAGNPDAMLDTTVGNAGLGLAKWFAALATGLHAWNSDPSGALEPFDNTLIELSDFVRQLVVDEWAIVSILVGAVFMFVWAITREVRKAMVSLLIFCLATGFLSIVGTQPLRVAHAIDGVASSITQNSDQKALQIAGISAEPDEALGAIMNDEILYPLWAKGALGRDDQTKAGADTFANRLYRAQATTYDQNGDSADDKKDEYEDVFDDIGDSEDSGMQDVLRGKNYYNRSAMGLGAAAVSFLVSGIRIVSEMLIFASELIFRLVPIIGPIFAILAFNKFTRGVAREGLNMVGAAAINVVIFGVCASLHTAIIAFFAAKFDFAALLFASAVVTFVFWKFTKPFRSLTQLATGGRINGAVHGATDLNPINKLLGAWALINTGQRVGSKNDSGDRERSVSEETGNDSRRHNKTVEPEYIYNDPAEPNYERGESPASWERSPDGTYSFDNMPELENEYRRPQPQPEYEQPRNAPQPTYEAAPQNEEQPEYEQPQTQPYEAAPQQPYTDDGEPIHTEERHVTEETTKTRVESADAAANAQLDDQHYEREESERIVRAVERASSELRQGQDESTNRTADNTSQDGNNNSSEIVQVPRTPSNDVYFNPEINTETQTRFNQHIFVPQNEPSYEYHDEETRTDHYEESTRGEN